MKISLGNNCLDCFSKIKDEIPLENNCFFKG